MEIDTEVVSTLEKDHFDRKDYHEEFTELFQEVERWSLRRKNLVEETKPIEPGYYSPAAM